MKALTYLGLGLTAAFSLGLPWPVVASDAGHGGASVSSGSSGHSSFVAHAGGYGGGFHAPAASYHASSGFHAPSGAYHTAPRVSTTTRYAPVSPAAGSARAPTFAFGGHPTDPPAAATQRSTNGSNRPTRGWDRHWDRVWHGRHYHWNNGAWVIINDGYYPWDDSYYLPASPDVYPDMSYEYDDTAPDVGGPNPAPSAPPEVAAGPRADTIAVDVQQGLASRGYYDGRIDGVVGDATRQAIADFQKDNNLPITGYITKPLLNALGL